MLISVCIPHYNRAEYLIGVLDSIKAQDYPKIEVIISDDCSTDDSRVVIPRYLESLRRDQIKFCYFRQEHNMGYDANVRAALSGATGEYLLLLGNDDCLAYPKALSDLVASLKQLKCPDVCYSNFFEFGSPNQIVRRAPSTTVLGSGPAVASRVFRSFSFVGGVIFKRTAFEEHNASSHDGSVYVQVYLAARIIAAGGVLASLSRALVAKDFKIEGACANSYVDVLALQNQTIARKTGGLDRFGEVACKAILPYIAKSRRGRYVLVIFGQILLFTYPFWLFTYRKTGSYRAAINLALGCFPPHLTRFVKIQFHVEALLVLAYLPITAVGLLFPLAVFDLLKNSAFKISKGWLGPRQRVANS